MKQFKKATEVINKNGLNNTETLNELTKLFMSMKNAQNAFGDITHEDGSKSYENIRGGYITIKRPEVVDFVERILSQNFLGWAYASSVEEAYKTGFITKEEQQQIYLILD